MFHRQIGLRESNPDGGRIERQCRELIDHSQFHITVDGHQIATKKIAGLLIGQIKHLKDHFAQYTGA